MLPRSGLAAAVSGIERGTGRRGLASGYSEIGVGPGAVEPVVVPACGRALADGDDFARARAGAGVAATGAGRWTISRCSGVAGESVTLSGFLEQTFTDGLLVLKDGAIAYERYFNGMDAQTLHLSQSVAKSFVGDAGGHSGAAAGDRGQRAAHRLRPRTEGDRLSRRDAAACARHDERGALQRGLYRSAVRYGAGRRGVRVEAGPRGRRSGGSLAAVDVRADPEPQRPGARAWRGVCLPLDRNRCAGVRPGACDRQAAGATAVGGALAEARHGAERQHDRRPARGSRSPMAGSAPASATTAGSAR